MNKKHIITFVPSDDQYSRMEKITNNLGISKTAMVREACDCFLGIKTKSAMQKNILIFIEEVNGNK